jgi:coenzyme F420-reducing hydrogenase gamma subunit
MRVGVFKFSSCDGCQLAFFELEEEFLSLAEVLSIEYFLEASSENRWTDFDLAFVEGSISTPEEEDRIRKIRENSKILIAIGACAVSGGIQSARNYEDFQEIFTGIYRGRVSFEIKPHSRPISDFVKVDLEIRGCPINREHLRNTIYSLLIGLRPELPAYPLCLECKRKGNACVVVSKGQLCLGPITCTGCGALCPSFGRGCYGCFGPSEKPNYEAFYEMARRLGIEEKELKVALRLSFNGYNPALREVL